MMAKKTIDKDSQLQRYEELFAELTLFTKVISDQDAPIEAARAAVAQAKAKLEEAKGELCRLEQIRDGAKHNLYRFLCPTHGKFQPMPLFDRMEPTDESVHGENANEWRVEPVSALGLSLPSLQALADADVVLVGQLQDLVIASRDWWEKISGLNAGSAAAIVDRLNDFIADRS